MTEIRWSSEAVERVKRIKKYIEKESPSGAHKFARGILECVENIAHFPRIGKSAFSDIHPNLRLLIWKDHKIYYEYNEPKDIVEIWGVWDSRSMLAVRKK